MGGDVVGRILFGLLIVVGIVLLGLPGVAFANVPEIVGLSTQPIIDCGTPLAGRGFLLLITVTHAGPTISHYVDKIETLKEKTTETMDLQPESDETFTVTAVICEGKDYSPGQELAVRVRAHCTIHGWGDWSSSVTVPEFSQPALIGLVALIAALSLISFRRRRLHLRRFLDGASKGAKPHSDASAVGSE